MDSGGGKDSWKTVPPKLLLLLSVMKNAKSYEIACIKFQNFSFIKHTKWDRVIAAVLQQEI